MKPPSFDYADAETVEQAVALLKEHEGDAKVLAGGQSLLPLLNMRLARPSLLVDIRKVEALNYIRQEDGGLGIGAMTSERTIERSALVKERHPLLHAATCLIGHPQIRNRGTIGGSLVHADPASEYPAMALALDAELRAAGPDGERTIKAEDFFVTYLTTALAPAEVLTSVHLPALPERSGWAIQEITRRRGDFALAGAVATATLSGDGTIAAARIVIFGVAPTAVRARGAEDILIGERPDEKLFERAGLSVTEEVDGPLSDIHGSSEYRTHLAGVLTRRTLAEAVSRAEGG